MSKVKAEIMAWSLGSPNANAGFTTTFSFSIPAWLPEPFRMVKRYTISTISLNLQAMAAFSFHSQN